MKNLLILAFFVCIPAFLFLGHDLYVFYDAQGKPMDPMVMTKLTTETRPAKAFDFSSIGYVLNKYAPFINEAIMEDMTSEEREKYQLFLTYKGFYLAVAFAIVIMAIGFIVVMLKSAEIKIRELKYRRR